MKTIPHLHSYKESLARFRIVSTSTHLQTTLPIASNTLQHQPRTTKMSIPATHKEFRVNLEGPKDFTALEFNEKAPVPKLGDKDVLVKRESANFP